MNEIILTLLAATIVASIFKLTLTCKALRALSLCIVESNKNDIRNFLMKEIKNFETYQQLVLDEQKNWHVLHIPLILLTIVNSIFFSYIIMLYGSVSFEHAALTASLISYSNVRLFVTKTFPHQCASWAQMINIASMHVKVTYVLDKAKALSEVLCRIEKDTPLYTSTYDLIQQLLHDSLVLQEYINKELTILKKL